MFPMAISTIDVRIASFVAGHKVLQFKAISQH